MTGGRPGPVVDLTGPQASWPPAGLGLWREATDHVMTLRDAWHPPPLQGDRRLREVLAEILGEDADHILVTSGVRASASFLARTSVQVLHERPSFRGTFEVLRACHDDVALVSWPELRARSRRTEGIAAGSLVWLTTPCRNPDGASLVPGDWQWIDRVATTSRVVVNEVYRWFAGAVDRPARVWMTGSLSKLAGSGAGLGWIRGPDAADLAPHQHVRPSSVWQRCWSYLLERGGLELLVEHTVRSSARAVEAFVEELRPATGIEHHHAPGGTPPFVLIAVPTATSTEFVARLTRRGVHVGPGDDFLADTPSVRACFVDVSPAAAAHAGRLIATELRAAGGG